MSHTLSSGRCPADRSAPRPARTATAAILRREAPRPATRSPRPTAAPAKVRGASMDYQLGFTSGPSS